MTTVNFELIKKAVNCSTTAENAFVGVIRKVMHMNSLIEGQMARINGVTKTSISEVESEMCFRDDFSQMVKGLLRSFIALNREVRTVTGEFALPYLRSDNPKAVMELDEEFLRKISSVAKDAAETAKFLLDHPDLFGIEWEKV